jgi:hypothetical protein
LYVLNDNITASHNLTLLYNIYICILSLVCFVIFRASYSPKYWYWEIVETSRRLMLTAVLSVINPRTPQQAVCACFVSLAYIKLYSSQRPYNDNVNNYLSEIGQYQIFFTFFFSLILQNSLLPGDIWRGAIGISLICLNMGVVIAFMKCEYDSYKATKSVNHSSVVKEKKKDDDGGTERTTICLEDVDGRVDKRIIAVEKEKEGVIDSEVAGIELPVIK